METSSAGNQVDASRDPRRRSRVTSAPLTQIANEGNTTSPASISKPIDKKALRKNAKENKQPPSPRFPESRQSGEKKRNESSLTDPVESTAVKVNNKDSAPLQPVPERSLGLPDTPEHNQHNVEGSATSIHPSTPQHSRNTTTYHNRSQKAQRSGPLSNSPFSSGNALSPSTTRSATEIVAFTAKIPVVTHASPSRKGPPPPVVVTTPSRTARRQVKSDLSQIMWENERGATYDWVRGEGIVRIEDNVVPQTPTEPFKSPLDIPDQVFFAKTYMDNGQLIHNREMRWSQGFDGFNILLDEGEVFSIHAVAISSVSYDINIGKFFLYPNATAPAEFKLDEALLEVGGDDQSPWMLRVIFERRLGATKVNMADSAFFIQKEKALTQFRQRSFSTRVALTRDSVQGLSDGMKQNEMVDRVSILSVAEAVSVPFSDAVDEGDGRDSRESTIAASRVAKDDHPATDETPLPGLSSSPDTIRVHHPKFRTVEVRKRRNDNVEESISPSDPMKTSSTTSRLPRRLDRLFRDKGNTIATPKKVDKEQGTKATRSRVRGGKLSEVPLPVVDEVEATAVVGTVDVLPNDTTPGSPSSPVDDDPRNRRDERLDDSKALYYRSGERVKLHDLVIRIRDPASIEGGKNKFDTLDVYDGPFLIRELPPCVTVGAVFSDDDEAGRTRAPKFADKPDKNVVIAMQEKLVKLQFPADSKVEPWTRLGRLRPIYDIHPDVPEDASARNSYYYGKGIEGSRSPLNKGKKHESSDQSGVCRIQKGAYVKVQYVAAEGPNGDDQFEVEKLRYKRIDRCDLAEYPDEKMTDPAIVRYLEGGGSVDESEVLVTRYLVHWAGWPSEDDTYERAQDNIPQEFIDKYVQSVGDAVEVPEGPAKKKRRVSGARKSSQT